MGRKRTGMTNATKERPKGKIREAAKLLLIDPKLVSYAKMAKDLGIDTAHSWRIWAGKITPSVKLGRRMCEWLAIPENNPANTEGNKVTLDELYEALARIAVEK